MRSLSVAEAHIIRSLSVAEVVGNHGADLNKTRSLSGAEMPDRIAVVLN